MFLFGPSRYPENDLMPKLFLTNVRREDDATTRALRQVLGPLRQRSERLDGLVVFHCALWRAFGTKESGEGLLFKRISPWMPCKIDINPRNQPVKIHNITIYLYVYYYILYVKIYVMSTSLEDHLPCRFHSKSLSSFEEFIRELGFVDLEAWGAEAQGHVVDVALRCWRRGQLCFTEAYCPSRCWWKRERKASQEPRGEETARSLFWKEGVRSS